MPKLTTKATAVIHPVEAKIYENFMLKMEMNMLFGNPEPYTEPNTIFWAYVTIKGIRHTAQVDKKTMELKTILGSSYTDIKPATKKQIKEAKFERWLSMMEL